MVYVAALAVLAGLVALAVALAAGNTWITLFALEHWGRDGVFWMFMSGYIISAIAAAWKVIRKAMQ